MEEEVWKDVKGYEGLYRVSNLGRLKSLGNEFSRKEKILKPCFRNGYSQTALTMNKVCKRIYIHRLVGLNFIDNPLNKSCINHKNGIRNDNRVENLEWVTHKENIQHAHSLGLATNSHCFKKVSQHSLAGEFIKEHLSIAQAARSVGGSAQNISMAAKGQYSKSYGFTWRFS